LGWIEANAVTILLAMPVRLMILFMAADALPGDVSVTDGEGLCARAVTWLATPGW
jgi:pyrrolidone-carboxylate peptidase